MKVLTIDVGGTFIKYAVMNENAEVISRGKIPTPRDSHEDFIKAITDLHNENDNEGIAMSLPGVIDAERGISITSGALGYNNGCNIVEELQKICGVKVAIENDAKCAGLAEAKIGSLADVSDGFVMVFGTGVGGAFIKNHEVHRGKNHSAGEVSFMIDSYDEDTEEMTYFGIEGGVPTLLKSYAQVKNLSIDEVSGESFFKAVDANENDAITCLDKFTRRVAVKMFNIQMILDPEKFAIGGGISAQESFINAIRKNVEYVNSKSIVKMPNVEIVPCKFRNDANLIGALMRFL